MYRVSVTRRAFVAALAALPLTIPLSTSAHGFSKSAGLHRSPASELLRDTMRSLWEDHITWTRLYIVSAVSDLPDKDATAERLLRNQDDIGAAIAPYYGDDAATQLSELLRGHILGAAALIDAAKAGDQAEVEAKSSAWYGNSDDIATFLSTANPTQWPLDATKAEMRMHLDLTLAEAVHRLQGDYTADIADFDEIRTHILGFADLLSAGIEGQFPERFV